MDRLEFLFKLPRLSESVDSAFSSSVKSDYGAQKEKEKKKNRFWKFDLSAPDVKSASRNKFATDCIDIIVIIIILAVESTIKWKNET